MTMPNNVKKSDYFRLPGRIRCSNFVHSHKHIAVAFKKLKCEREEGNHAEGVAGGGNHTSSGRLSR